MKLTAILILAALTLAACGSSEEPAATTDNQAIIEEAEAVAVSQADATAHLRRELNAKPDEFGMFLEYRAAGAANPCSLILVLTTPQEIALYEDAGDAILKNPSGTVGVKLSTVTTDRAACMRAASDALESL